MMLNNTQKIRLALMLILSIQPVILLAGSNNPSETGLSLVSDSSLVSTSQTTHDSSHKSLLHPISGTKGRALNGKMSATNVKDRSISNADDGLDEQGEMYAPAPYQLLPIIDAALATKINNLDNSQGSIVEGENLTRLIIYLDYHPHAQVFEQIIQANKSAIDNLENKRLGLLAETAVKRDLDAETDALNYPSMLLFDDSYKADMKAMNEEHEALSLTIKTEAVRQISGLVNNYQQPIKAQLTDIGIEVEFGTVAGNILVVKAPLNQVENIAAIPGVLRITEDVLMNGHLDVLPAATLVDPADTSLIGLWDSNFFGGIYDPAIIDSGLDDSHPAMDNNVTPLRDNFQTWYLVAANGFSGFDDMFTTDDLQGHGTAVAGIVGSQGSPGFTDRLGMAHGVQKLVNLKAGFLNTSGTTGMFYSDMYRVVDRGLYNSEQLMPSSTFLDDIDGMNLSYGGLTTLDDSDVGRFLDSVIDTYSDLPITVSVGNFGPSNTLFFDSASAYNVITVGNANDRGTVSRADDIMNAGSTVGPTTNNRRKPDISTYGTSISSPNNDWETETDFTNFTGSSAAAPVVLGVIMDLADAGVFDEVTVKALLINTAQKNLPSMSIESDVDGWDPQMGWGVMNAYAAFFHRFDTFTDSVTPRNTDGEYQLYKGSMRDEGVSGEGRDRATLVWNRSATYLPNLPPSDFFTLSDLNMRLYAEDNNGLLDIDTDANDNVHQVRIGAGSADTDVVVKVYAWSTVFDNGDTAQSYALATEDGFTRTDFPTLFQAIAQWPTEVEPNEEFTIEFWIRNDSEVASHNNEFDLNLPAGFTLIGGVDTQNVGSAAAGGITSSVTYTIRAPAVVGDGANIQVLHSHNSYAQEYGAFNWNIGLDVKVDTTPPNPNPMGYSTEPYNSGLNELSMTGQSAFDIHADPIQYYHDYTSSPSGGTSSNDSGWIANRSYTDTGLGTNHEYCYRVWARDSANFPNNTVPSPVSCAYTSQDVPAAVQIDTVITTSITVSAAALPANIILGSSGIQFGNVTEGNTSAWLQDNSPWVSNGLTPATEYDFYARARNGDGDETAAGTPVTASTLANPPAVNSTVLISDSQIKINLNANGNGVGAEYLIQNITSGNNSGWNNSLSWTESGLACNTHYTYQARARNPDAIETIIVSVGVVINDCNITNYEIFKDGFED